MSKWSEIVSKLQGEFPFIPVPVQEIAKSKNIEITMAGSLGKNAGSIGKNGDKYEICINIFDNYTRQRFTLAHELGHYFLHKDKIQDEHPLVDSRLYRSGLSTSIEVEANKFATALLMPTKEVYRLLKGKSISELAEMFAVPKMAMSIKLGIPIESY